MLIYISNSDHYKEVLSRVQNVKHTLWIGTADIKDLYVEVAKRRTFRVNESRKNMLFLPSGRKVEQSSNLFWHSLPSSFVGVLRCVSFMQRSLVRTFERTLISTWFYMTVWSECFVLAFILRCLSLTARRCTSEVQTLQVPASA